MTEIEIDLNVRVRGDQTYSGFEDVKGDIRVGDTVRVYEGESGFTGHARVTDIDNKKEIVYLSVDWENMEPRQR